MTVTYREAGADDAATILAFIKELAVYEKLAHEVVATEDDIRRTMFGDRPHCFCLLAEHQGVPVGFCVYFYNYSTFLGRYGIYIEDVYVQPGHRSFGIGKGFFQAIARKAQSENCGRVQWSVLDWNEPSIQFYEKMGATCLKEWLGYRLEGDAIAAVAGQKDKAA